MSKRSTSDTESDEEVGWVSFCALCSDHLNIDTAVHDIRGQMLCEQCAFFLGEERKVSLALQNGLSRAAYAHREDLTGLAPLKLCWDDRRQLTEWHLMNQEHAPCCEKAMYCFCDE